MPERTRRTFLRLTSVAVAPTALSRGSTQPHAPDTDDWEAVDPPTQRTLHDAVHAEAGAFAVGSGGVILERTEDGWSFVTESGPAGNGNNLSSTATTSNGDRLWVAGASGTVGEYDPSAESVTSRSAPDDVTNTFTDIAVTGPAGDATVYLVDASGNVHVSEENGEPGTWTHTTPGSGAEISAVAVSDSTGFLVDQNGSIFKTTDGETWTELDTPSFDETLTDVGMRSSETVVLAGSSGTVVIGSNGEWEQESAANAALHDVEVEECGCVHAVGASGTILHRTGYDTPPLRTLSRWFDWWTQTSPTGQNLHAVALGHPHIAVGASGTILER
ncbi:WD40/YVTN/BNR-like repeat-containing protein [Halobacterium noricense]|uniref:WD40/YVTN/BNR-like repeat-containing protein n=1 Tax=Halobacterium noricense TaxID=223182 RepID=UPI001E54936B|nr:hypothetical protein [Halobacterium noricense]UHH23918.1 hypothetical protein LT974_07875 [Halobacterium noricense]